jgi:hypothetical protein
MLPKLGSLLSSSLLSLWSSWDHIHAPPCLAVNYNLVINVILTNKIEVLDSAQAPHTQKKKPSLVSLLA